MTIADAFAWAAKAAERLRAIAATLPAEDAAFLEDMADRTEDAPFAYLQTISTPWAPIPPASPATKPPS